MDILDTERRNRSIRQRLRTEPSGLSPAGRRNREKSEQEAEVRGWFKAGRGEHQESDLREPKKDSVVPE